MSDRYNPFGLSYLDRPVDTPNYSVDSRWPDQPSVADAFQMGHLAHTDQYSPTTYAPFDAYDRAQQAQHRDERQQQAVQRSADVARGLAGQQGPADIRPVVGGMKMADMAGDMLAPDDVLGASTLFNPVRIGRKAIPAAAGAVLGSDTAEAAGRPRVPRGKAVMGGVADVTNWTPPGIGHNNPPVAARFGQYAEEYPPVGPPVLAIDPKTKKEFWSKELTPEAVAFQKERKRISDDMAKNGYQPYFDVAQRQHVDPANYPPNVDTTTIVPKKQATIDKHMENIGSEEARTRLRAAFERGTQLPNTADWYAMKQLEDEFIKELGPQAGRKAFQDRIATSMAATTGGADPTSNWMMAHYGNYLRATGKPYPEAAHQMPFPIGGRYASGNMAMHKKIFDEGGFSALGAANPKRHNFSQNFTGNRGAATMDEQMTSGMTPKVMMPPPGTYGLYEKVLGEEAAKVGVRPQNYQDVGWSGFKNMKDPSYTAGQPFIQTINESIERTHRLTGMPKDEILRRGIIKGEIPMYALMGAVGMGAIADQSRYPK
jgi:hypothetical protein